MSNNNKVTDNLD